MKGRKLLPAVLMLVALGGCHVGREVGRRAYLSARYRFARVPTESMAPTIRPGDLVAIDDDYYSSHPVERFDIVIFKHQELDEASGEKDVSYVQRVIAVGGERVEILSGQLYVDGEELSQPFYRVPHAPDEDFKQIIVPAGEYFMLGDHRRNSFDSRYWKKPTLAKEFIRGKVVEIIPQ